MTDKVYSPYKLAIELGFDEEQAKRFEWNGTNATNMRGIAKHLGLPSTKPNLAKPELEAQRIAEAKVKAEADAKAKPEPKKHRHSYHKDGTCRCGAVRKVKR